MDHSRFTTPVTSFKKPTRPTHDETDSLLACSLSGSLCACTDEIGQSHRPEDRRFGFAGTYHGDSEKAGRFSDPRSLLGTGQRHPRYRRGPALDFRSVQKL